MSVRAGREIPRRTWTDHDPRRGAAGHAAPSAGDLFEAAEHDSHKRYYGTKSRNALGSAVLTRQADCRLYPGPNARPTC